MTTSRTLFRVGLGLSATLSCLVGLHAEDAVSAPDPWSALKEGTVSLDARYRYEFVDVESSEKDAHASTLRVRLGYLTGTWQGFSGFLEFEGTERIGNKLYSDPTDPMPGRPTVLDPESAEFNRYWLKYTGLDGAAFKLGRQRIIHDDARFIGNVGWRQNEQTFDAFQAVYTGVENLKLEYDFVYNVNRIIGSHGADSTTGSPVTGQDAMTSHFAYGAYVFEGIGKLSAYLYSLDYAHKDPLDSTTAGLTFSGAYKVGEDWSALYTASFASQSDAYDSELDLGESYYRLEAGAKWRSIAFKLGYEVLSGDGDVNFFTPLATVHAFNGWSDVLLPGAPTALPDGLEDLYVTVGGAIPQVDGLKAALFYHLFSGNESGDDYGTEFDLVATYQLKQIDPGLMVGAKAAVYSADDESATEDVTRFWLWTEYKF